MAEMLLRGRPVGVTSLAIFDFVGGMILSLLGSWEIAPAPGPAEVHSPPIPFLFGLFLILLGLFVIYTGYEMWSGKGRGLQVWAYYSFVVPAGGGLALWGLPVAQILQIGVFLAALLLGGPLIILYLQNPAVKAFFSKKQSRFC